MACHPLIQTKEHDDDTCEPRPKEGPIAKPIEQQTARMPSDWFLWAPVGSMAGSLILEVSRNRHRARWSGWAPTLLILGVYTKVVKQLGSDGASRAAP
jgi:hypothetical protein